MKLSGREAARFCAAPDPKIAGILLHGPDAGRIGAERRRILTAVLGADADDLRRTELGAADVRRDPALVDDAMRARGFFPGRRVVVVEGGTDGMSKGLAPVLEDVDPADAVLVVTAGVLPARSSLRKMFESGANLMALQFFDDAPDPREIEETLSALGLTVGVDRDALELLVHVAASLDHGSYRQMLERVAVYGLDAVAPLNAQDMAGLVPTGLEAEIDAFVDAVATGRTDSLGPLLKRLGGSGVTPVSLMIAMQRHVRMLVRIASSSGGPARGLQEIRPPLWGPRRNAVEAQMRRWSLARLEQAARLLFETDGRIRSGGYAPDMALVERCALRIAMMAGR